MTDDTPDVPTMQQTVTDETRALASLNNLVASLRDEQEPGLNACIEAVDLSIAYKPVCPRSNDATIVYDVKRVRGGGFLLMENNVDGSPKHYAQRVDAEQLRVMRARYLYRHGIYYELLARDVLARDERDWVITHYFEGSVLILPAIREQYRAHPMSDQTKMAWEWLSSIKPRGAWWQA